MSHLYCYWLFIVIDIKDRCNPPTAFELTAQLPHPLFFVAVSFVTPSWWC